MPPTDPPAGTVEAQAEAVLTKNWSTGQRAGVPYAYTRPSPVRYPWQWYWDSCFAAIAWRHFDPARSRSELESLLAAQRPSGFIGHTIFWNRPVSIWRRIFYNVRDRSAEMTETIQPPLLAWAWRIAVGDPAEEPRIGAHADWLAENRDLDGDGLLWIVQPDESGMDSSPKFDPVWGGRAHGLLGFPRLVAHNRHHDWNARAILADGGPLLCEVVVNVLWGLSLQSLGRPSITPALVDRLWDDERGMFLDEAKPSGLRPAVETCATLAPLALPDLPEEIGRRLVEEHLLDERRFWLEFPPPSVAATEPAFEPGATGGLLRRYWRGATWVNTAWLAWLGLVRLGYEEPAQRLAGQVRAMVASEGLREYYNPHTGAGLGARDFTWTALAVEMGDARRAAEVASRA